MTAKQITLSIATLYFLVGNIVGHYYVIGAIEDELLVYIFIPYTVIFDLSALVGFDWLGIVFEVMAFLFTIAVFFPIGLYLVRQIKKHNTIIKFSYVDWLNVQHGRCAGTHK